MTVKKCYLLMSCKPILIRRKDPFITEKGVRFIYQKYEIGAGALGDVDVVIPYADIAEYMSEDAFPYATIAADRS